MEPISPPSLSEYLIPLCFSLGGLCFAALGWLIQHQRPYRSRTKGFVLGLLSAWIGWGAAYLVLTRLYPGYPEAQAAPDTAAVAFAYLGIVSATIVLKWLESRSPPTRGTPRSRSLVFASVVAATVTVGITSAMAYNFATEWPARRLLPDKAAVLHEAAFEADFPLPDYSYRIRARMSGADFHVWMRRLGVKPTRFDSLRYGDESFETTMNRCSARATYSAGVGIFESMCR